MRVVSQDFTRAVASGGTPVLELTSWLGGRLIGTITDIVAGSWELTDEADVTVPGSIKFAVASTPANRPLTATHPLAAYGQRIRARVGFGDELVTWGWYRMERPAPDGNLLTCRGLGLLREMERARLVNPVSFAKAATHRQIVSQLTRGIIPVAFDAALPSRASGGGVWEEDRLGACLDVLKAWPARGQIDDSGVWWITPDWATTPTTPDWTVSSGVNLTELQPDWDGSDPFNGYRVSTVPEGDEAAISEFWGIPSGPMRWGGPYGWNPGLYASPLLPANRSTLRSVAQSMTLRQARWLDAVQATTPFDPRVEIGDVAHVRSDRMGVDRIGRVTALSLTRSRLKAKIGGLS